MTGYNDKKVLVLENSRVVSDSIKKALITSGINGENITTAAADHQALLIVELVKFLLFTTAVYMNIKYGAQLLGKFKKKRQKRVASKNAGAFHFFGNRLGLCSKVFRLRHSRFY